MTVNKIFLTVIVVAMIFATTVSLSYQTANAQNTNENSKELLDQLRNGTETFYKIEVDVAQNSRAVGIFGDCNVPGKTVKTSECVFSVDAIRYILPEVNGAFPQTKFEVICIDNITPRQDTQSTSWSNCSFLDRGAVSIGGTIGWSNDAKLGGKAGEIGSAGIIVSLGSSPTVGVSYDAIRLEYLMKNPDEFEDVAAGGNVLADSGIGGVLAGKYVILAHDSFNGRVEFVGSKPLNMEMSTGYIASSKDPKCNNTSGSVTDCGDENLSDFKTALELAFPVVSFQSSSVNAEPATSSTIAKNIDADLINEIIDKTTPQLAELNSLNKELALEIINLNEFLTAYKEIRNKGLMDKLVDQIVLEIEKENDPERILDEILDLRDWVDYRPGLRDIAGLLIPLAIIEDIVGNQIIPPTDIGVSVGDIADNMTALDNSLDGASVTFELPEPFDDVDCTASVDDVPMCTGFVEVKADRVKCTLYENGNKGCTVDPFTVHTGTIEVCVKSTISGNKISASIVGDGCLCDPGNILCSD